MSSTLSIINILVIVILNSILLFLISMLYLSLVLTFVSSYVFLLVFYSLYWQTDMLHRVIEAGLISLLVWIFMSLVRIRVVLNIRYSCRCQLCPFPLISFFYFLCCLRNSFLDTDCVPLLSQLHWYYFGVLRMWCEAVRKGKISIILWLNLIWASLVPQTVKNPPAMQETWVRSLGWEDPLEEGLATHFSILAWRIPWTEKPGGP